jgi:hypothetical protein
LLPILRRDRRIGIDGEFAETVRGRFNGDIGEGGAHILWRIGSGRDGDSGKSCRGRCDGWDGRVHEGSLGEISLQRRRLHVDVLLDIGAADSLLNVFVRDAQQFLEAIELDKALLGVKLEILVHLGLEIHKDVLVELVESIHVCSLSHEHPQGAKRDVLLGILHQDVQRSVAMEVLLVGICATVQEKLDQFILVMILAHKVETIFAISVQHLDSTSASDERLDKIVIWDMFFVKACDM